MRERTAFLILLLFLAGTGVADAAVRLEYRVESESSFDGATPSKAQGTDVLFIDSGIAVSSNDTGTMLLDLSKSELTIVSHQKRTYEVARVPFVLEDYATAEQRELMKKLDAMVAASVEIQEGSDLTTKGSWKVRQVHVEATAPALGSHTEITAWFSTEPEMDYSVFDAFLKNTAAMNFTRRNWANQVIDLEGMAVYQEVRERTGKMVRTGIRELISVTQTEIPAELLVPPEGYRKVPLEAEEYFGALKQSPQ